MKLLGALIVLFSLGLALGLTLRPSRAPTVPAVIQPADVPQPSAAPVACDGVRQPCAEGRHQA